MSRGILVRNPVAKHRHEVVTATAGTHITSAAWTEIITSLAAPVDAIEILNSTGSVLKIATGAAASEVELPFYILPSSEPHLIPFNIAKSTRISAKAVDSDVTTDSQLVFNFYG